MIEKLFVWFPDLLLDLVVFALIASGTALCDMVCVVVEEGLSNDNVMEHLRDAGIVKGQDDE